MFRLMWREGAFERMDAIVQAFPDRKTEFAVALRHLSAALSADPVGTGESRDPPYRVGFFGPLTVYFEPVPAQRLVTVVGIWLRSEGDPD